MTTTAQDVIDLLGGYTPTFDKSRDFGEVHGEERPYGVSFEQDGFHFDHAGRFIPELVTDDNLKALRRKARMRMAQAAAQEAMKKVLDDGEDAGAAASLQVGIVDTSKVDPDSIDLKAWAASGGTEPKVQFAVISNLVAKVYGDKPTRRERAIEIIQNAAPLPQS